MLLIEFDLEFMSMFDSFFLIAESFLDQPTAFGVPLGTLLLFYLLMKSNQKKDN